MEKLEYLTVAERFDGARLDAYLAETLGVSRSAAQGLIEAGHVRGAEKVFKKNHRCATGETFSVTLPEPQELTLTPQEIPLNIVYEDAHLIVLNKAKGMVVHPAPGNWDGTLVNALLFHCGDSLSVINGALRPGIVHRLDKDTSGLMVVAKDDEAHRGLAEQIQRHEVRRTYEAVVIGHMKEPSGTIDAPIGRHKTDRKRMCVTREHSREAITHYQVLAEYPGYSHLRLRLETGRTHQIRVHLAYVGHPVLGDSVYGLKNNPFGLDSQCLHSREIEFTHPVTGKYMSFTSDLPEYFQYVLKRIQ